MDKAVQHLTGTLKKPLAALLALFATQYIFPNFIGRFADLLASIIIVWLYPCPFLLKRNSLFNGGRWSLIEKLMWGLSVSLVLAGVVNAAMTGFPSDILVAACMGMACGPLISAYLRLDTYARTQGQLVLSATATFLAIVAIIINHTGNPTLLRFFTYNVDYFQEERMWARVVPIGYWAIAPVGLWFALRMYFFQRGMVMKVVMTGCATLIFYSMVLSLTRSLVFGTLSAVVVVLLFSFCLNHRFGLKWLVVLLFVGVLVIGVVILSGLSFSTIIFNWQDRLLNAPAMDFENVRATRTVEYARILFDDFPLLGSTQYRLTSPMDKDNSFFTTIWWQFGLIPALTYLSCILLTVGYLLRMSNRVFFKRLQQTQLHVLFMVGCCIQLFWNMASGYSLVLSSTIPLVFVLAEVWLVYKDTMIEASFHPVVRKGKHVLSNYSLL